MIMSVTLFLSVWAFVLALSAALPILRLPKPIAWVFPLLGLALLAAFYDQPPAYRLLASSLFFLYLMKAAVLIEAPVKTLGALDRVLFTTIWPGMDAERLSLRQPAGKEVGAWFGKGLALTLAGGGGIVMLALLYPRLDRNWLGWLGIASLLTTIHFGVSGILTSALRLGNRPVAPLFDRPFASRSLSEFWTKRWNLAFVEMDRRFFLPALRRLVGRRKAVFGVFLVSGLLHEMAISYPAGAGWGGPLLYFAIQCVGLLLERRWRVHSRVWALVWVLAPLPALFHAPFRRTLIVPFFGWLYAQLTSWPLESYVSALLWSLPVMQLSVLLASVQVPRRLNWHEELAQLSSFNRKLMWTYGIFTVGTILAFAILTLFLHDSLMRGERAAVGLACFMFAFWTLRLLFDAFYFRSEDWPAGPSFSVGHALLNALFLYLALGYGIAGLWAATRL